MIGCGGVGLQVVAAAALAGASPIIAVDRDPAKLEIARHRGATPCDRRARSRSPRHGCARSSGGGVDHAFEVVGPRRDDPARLGRAAPRARPRSSSASRRQASRCRCRRSSFLSDKGIRGSYYGSGDPAADLPELAQLALRGELDLAGVVTHIDDLDGVNDALERLRRGEGARTVLVLDPGLAGAATPPA